MLACNSQATNVTEGKKALDGASNLQLHSAFSLKVLDNLIAIKVAMTQRV
jgi:hypothetical protein